MSSLRNSGACPDFSIESSLLEEERVIIAGVDEAGRGALAGPLSLAMVIYDSSIYGRIPEDIIETVADSKQLTEKKRLAARQVIKQHAAAYTRIFIPHKTIDSAGINGATELAVRMMLERIPIRPDIVIMDGNFRFKLDVPFLPVIRGDCRSLSIASASIIAKTDRDEAMCRLDSAFPGYGFARHKGYGTRAHIESIELMGVSPVHRLSYEPAKSMTVSRGILPG